MIASFEIKSKFPFGNVSALSADVYSRGTIIVLGKLSSAIPGNAMQLYSSKMGEEKVERHSGRW